MTTENMDSGTDVDFLGAGVPLTAPPFALEKGQRAILKMMGENVAEIVWTSNPRQTKGATVKLAGAAFASIVAGRKIGDVIKLVGRGLERTGKGNNVRAYDARLA